jgi:hypothetical protein
VALRPTLSEGLPSGKSLNFMAYLYSHRSFWKKL